jgi:hypothetical protein
MADGKNWKGIRKKNLLTQQSHKPSLLPLDFAMIPKSNPEILEVVIDQAAQVVTKWV